MLSMAFITTPFFGPSFAGKSNRMVCTLALVRCAAICAPITPAPSTATLRIWKLLNSDSYKSKIKTRQKGHFYKPAAWANFAPAVLAVHWGRVPCLPNPSARTSPARDGFEKFPKLKSPYRTVVFRQFWLKTPVNKGLSQSAAARADCHCRRWQHRSVRLR